MNPLHCLQADYFERVLTGTTTLLVEKGVVSVDELEQTAYGSLTLSGPIAADPTVALTPQPEPRFAAGDGVRVLPIHLAEHVRAPQFCRGHEGVILHRAPQFCFPDTSAHAGPHRKEHTYRVEFAAADLRP